MIYIYLYNCIHIHQEEESVLPFSTLVISSSSVADQFSSFRVARVADRISSRINAHQEEDLFFRLVPY